MTDAVLEVIHRAFAALVEGSHMREGASDANPPEYRKLYLNRTTGLEVVVDWSELRPFVWLLRLERGAPPLKRAPRLGEALSRVDVDDILLHRGVQGSPAGKLLARADVDSLAPRLAEYAQSIAVGCPEVLGGDFRVFDEIQPVVEARIRKHLA